MYPLHCDIPSSDVVLTVQLLFYARTHARTHERAALVGGAVYMLAAPASTGSKSRLGDGDKVAIPQDWADLGKDVSTARISRTAPHRLLCLLVVVWCGVVCAGSL